METKIKKESQRIVEARSYIEKAMTCLIGNNKLAIEEVKEVLEKLDWKLLRYEVELKVHYDNKEPF